MRQIHLPNGQTIVGWSFGVSNPDNYVPWGTPGAEALKSLDRNSLDWKQAYELGLQNYLRKYFPQEHPGETIVYVERHFDDERHPSFELYIEIPPEKRQRPLRQELLARDRHFASRVTGDAIRLPANFLKERLPLLIKAGLGREGDYEAVYLPLDTPTELWEDERSGRWESTTDCWLKVIGSNWTAKIPLNGKTIRGGLGDTNMYGPPSRLEVNYEGVGSIRPLWEFSSIFNEEDRKNLPEESTFFAHDGPYTVTVRNVREWNGYWQYRQYSDYHCPRCDKILATTNGEGSVHIWVDPEMNVDDRDHCPNCDWRPKAKKQHCRRSGSKKGSVLPCPLGSPVGNHR